MSKRPKRDPEDFAEEIRSHLELEADALRSEGVRDADDAARRAFGNVTAVREKWYERGRWTWLDELSQDMRYACRTMRKTPAYTAGAALLLALGIGANTALYSFVEAVAFRPMPVPDPSSLVLFKWHANSNPKVKGRHSGEWHKENGLAYVSGNFPFRSFETFSRNEVLESAFAFFPGDVTVFARSAADRGRSLYVSGEFFDGLRLAPALGRGIEPLDDLAGAPGVAVLGYSYWQSRFGGDAGVLGLKILVNNVPLSVVGVAPRSFAGLDTRRDADVYVPLQLCEQVRTAFAGIKPSIYVDDHYYWVMMMGRLKPGVTRRQAEAALGASWAGWVSETAQTDAEKANLPQFFLKSGAVGLDFLQHYYSRPIFIVAGMAVLILAIACANLANLQLTRAMARRREIVLRFGLGAGRGRIARQFLTESILLSAAGGALSLLFAFGGMRGLAALAGMWDPEVVFRVEMNWNCLAVTAALSIGSGLVFGVAPALQASRWQLAPGLRESRVGRSTGWLRRGALVTVQIAVSLLLVAGASLFVRSVGNLRSVALGFNPDRMLAFEADAHQAGRRAEALGRFYSEAIDRLRAIPGAGAVTAANYALVAGDASGTGIALPGNPTAGTLDTADLLVGPEYFSVMQIPIVAGREINGRDTSTAPMAVVVNEAFAAKHLQPGNPLGQTIQFVHAPAKPLATVVGVARNTPLDDLRKAPGPILFRPYQQHLSGVRRMTFFIRAAGSADIAGPGRRVIEAMDSRIPVVNVRTIQMQIDRTIGQERLFAILCSAFAGLALLIASVGLYGTLAYGVSRRASEIGVRIALGARRAQVVGLVLRESLALILAGIAIGAPVVWSSEKLIGSYLFRAASNDPRALAIPIVVLIASALVAAGLPAWRAARIDPVQALRHE